MENKQTNILSPKRLWDRLFELSGSQSNYALAKRLNVPQSVVSHWRNKKEGTHTRLDLTVMQRHFRTVGYKCVLSFTGPDMELVRLEMHGASAPDEACAEIKVGSRVKYRHLGTGRYAYGKVFEILEDGRYSIVPEPNKGVRPKKLKRDCTQVELASETPVDVCECCQRPLAV